MFKDVSAMKSCYEPLNICRSLQSQLYIVCNFCMRFALILVIKGSQVLNKSSDWDLNQKNSHSICSFLKLRSAENLRSGAFMRCEEL